MAEQGKYIYCIIDADGERSFGNIGIGSDSPEVAATHYKDIAAMISDSPIIKYRINREHTMAHQCVAEAAMQEHTVLPVRYGTIAKTEKLIQRVLERRYQEFKDTLLQMQDKNEMGVKVIWKQEAMYDEILNENEGIRTLRDELARSSLPPERTHWQRVKIGEMVEAAMDAKREREADKVVAGLKRYCVDYQINRNLLDRMVLNAAFLVEEEKERQFDEKIEALDAVNSHRLDIKYIGPVVPYNFITIVINLTELGIE
ncbi:GvpL/GvpF family gas vesicle protein [bacterium]|nr:GvpL/GvpF family gas vesicle protein [bacterium]